MSQPIIPWIGGKRRLAPHILPLLEGHTCYVEPFCGAAAIFFLKRPSDVEVINDINGELVNLYRVIQHHLEEFVRQFKLALTSRRVFEWEQAKVPSTLTDIQRAARFYYLQRNCFGAKLEGQTFGYGTTARRGSTSCASRRSSVPRICACRAATSSTWPGRTASLGTIARTACSIATRRTGRPRVTGSRSGSSSTRQWPG